MNKQEKYNYILMELYKKIIVWNQYFVSQGLLLIPACFFLSRCVILSVQACNPAWPKTVGNLQSAQCCSSFTLSGLCLFLPPVQQSSMRIFQQITTVSLCVIVLIFTRWAFSKRYVSQIFLTPFSHSCSKITLSQNVSLLSLL